ncbi:MAG: tRNA pseudouridine(55) synthase TruB [Candidatus Omnitrophica bacterium]|nr:tRNA pseudouridine(55) synthase TruB [Candidatus Omnitrophota bacterium]
MDGILLFNKPVLWTSHDAVDFVRRRARQRAVGHAGTLDPMATGLLVLLLGKATKLSQVLSACDKEYAGRMTLGLRTDTQDLEGKIIATADPSGVTQAQLEVIFNGFKGAVVQATPAFSAVKAQGKKMYEWARKGVAVELPKRKIFIQDFKLLAFEPPDVHFVLGCSKGTYVRALCDEIGQRLGCGATLSCLARTRVGPWTLQQALSEEKIIGTRPEDLSSCFVKYENLQRV